MTPKLDRQKQDLLAAIAGLAPQRIAHRPSPEVWSARDIVDHLAKTERSILNAVKTNLPHPHPVRLKDRLGAVMVNTVMRTPMKVKVPAGANSTIPDEALPFSDAVAEWDRVRESWSALLATCPTTRDGVFEHPVAGWMTLAGTLAFLSAHLQHHGYQLRRLAK